MEIGIQWPLVLFTVISGAGYGVLAAAGVARLAGKQETSTCKTALVAAMALLGVGGLMSVFHLAHPERFMAAIANLLSFSGIALELIGLAFGFAAAALFLVFASMGNRAGEKVLAACSVVIGVVAAFLQGWAYFEVAVQAGWSTVALPAGYLLTSLAAGFLAYAAIAAFKKEDAAALKLTGVVAAALAALATIAVAAYAAVLGGAGLLEGAPTALAALAAVLELAALALAAWFALKASTPTIALIGALAAVGGSTALRVLMWLVASYQFSFIWDAAANRGLYLF